jgi:hypothetical protein
MCGYIIKPPGEDSEQAGLLETFFPRALPQAFEPHSVKRREDVVAHHLNRRVNFSLVEFFDGLELADEGEERQAENLRAFVANFDPGSAERLRVLLLDAVVHRVGVHFVLVAPVPGSTATTNTVEHVVGHSGGNRQVIVIRLGTGNRLLPG